MYKKIFEVIYLIWPFEFFSRVSFRAMENITTLGSLEAIEHTLSQGNIYTRILISARFDTSSARRNAVPANKLAIVYDLVRR
jgi:hypothetical protein